MTKLTQRDIALVVKLAETKPQTEIAKIVGVSQAQISRLLAQFADTRGLAKAHLRSAAQKVAEAAVEASSVAAKRGDGSVALELLDRLDVAPKKAQGGHGSTQVMVVVGQAHPDALPPALTGLVGGTELAPQ